MKYFKYAFRIVLFPALLPVAMFLVIKELVKKGVNGDLTKVVAKVKQKDNVKLKLIDKNGKQLKIFKSNAIWRFFKRFGHDIRVNFLTGHWTYNYQSSNLVVTVGKALAADLLGDVNSVAAAEYIANGTGTTAAAAGDTALETETSATGLARAIGTTSLVTTSTTNDTLQVDKTFTNSSGGSVGLTEFGLLNAASVGTLFARKVESVVNIPDGSSIQVTWQIQFS